MTTDLIQWLLKTQVLSLLSKGVKMGRGFPRIGRILADFSGCICVHPSNPC
jgi:hypothetical protein